MAVEQLTVEAAGRVFADPGAYTDERRFHEACTLLRREAPITLVEADGFPPFYALTRHADVMEAERNPEVFRNLPQPVLMETERERIVRQAGDLATLVHMDDPDHRKYRALTADWFQPSSLARLEGRIAELARRAVDRMAALGGECDFAVDIATPMPLEVILSILGLPEADYPKMLQLTRELFQGDDPEFARGSTFEEFMTVMYDFFQYFGALVDERRARPTDDLASVIKDLDARGYKPRVLFLEATDAVLVRRFESVRRGHPMQGDGRLADGITAERKLLAPLREEADLVLETSALSVHDLRAKIEDAFGTDSATQTRVTVLSFGYKYGLPMDADLVMDVRFLPNPFWIPELRDHTGLDSEVRNYVLSQEGAEEFLDRYHQLLRLIGAGYKREGKRYLTMAVGCTGGKHRSVAISEELARLLSNEDGMAVKVIHRDLGRE